MTIASTLLKAIKNLQTATPMKDENGYTTLCIPVEPKYKNVITFLLECSLNSLRTPFSEVKTEIKSDAFTYQVEGNSREIKIFIPIYRFNKYNIELSDFFNKLFESARNLMGDLKGNWTYSKDYVLKTTSRGELKESEYINSKITGTLVSYLLTESAKVMGIENIIFSRWLPNAGGWVFADAIYLTGNKEAIRRFLVTSETEFSMQLNHQTKYGIFATRSADHLSVSIANRNAEEQGVVVKTSAAAASVTTSASHFTTTGNVFVMANNTNPNGNAVAVCRNIRANGGLITIASQADPETTEKILSIFKFK